MSFATVFNPTEFFAGSTTGAAVIRRGARIVQRCTIETVGTHADSYGALHFDERYVFDDDAPDDVMQWAVSQNGSSLEAAEPTIIGPIWSKIDGHCWKLKFKRHRFPPNKGPLLQYDVNFCLISDDLVIKTVSLKLYGLTLAKLQGFHARR